MENHVLFRRGRRISIRQHDITSEKISMIFQVRADTVYLIDDCNKVILPGQDGAFDSLELLGGGHYEVYGESTADGEHGESAASTANQQTPVRFAFRRPSTATNPSTSAGCSQFSRSTGIKMSSRNIFLAELIDGRLETQKTVTIKFSEFESSLPTIKAKVAEALGQDQALVLIDSHHNEIIDCEGKRGPAFSKQNARKIYAVPEDQLQKLRGNKRKRESRHGDNALPEVFDQIEEVLLASQGLHEVFKVMKDLITFVRGNRQTTLCLSEDQAAALKSAFSCVICGDPMKDPVFASCCSTVLGCRPCLDRWQDNHSHCPKCRTDDCSFHMQSVVGLDDAVSALCNVITGS